jgi:hypothetical protein
MSRHTVELRAYLNKGQGKRIVMTYEDQGQGNTCAYTIYEYSDQLHNTNNDYVIIV